MKANGLNKQVVFVRDMQGIQVLFVPAF